MYTSAIAKEITVRDIDRSYKNLHGNEKKTWEKNQYIYKMYYLADKQNIQMQKGSSPYLYITVRFVLNSHKTRNIFKSFYQQALKNHHFRRILDI